MSIAIVTENHVFGELLRITCHDKNINVVGIFESTNSVQSLHAGDLLLVHVRADDLSLPAQITDLKGRFGDLNVVFLVSDTLSAQMRSAIAPLATITVAEKETCDALTSALTLAELGYHLSALTDLRGAPDGPAQETAASRDTSDPDPHLTNREAMILEHLCQGLPNKSIALRLGITETTVKVHLRAAYRKIGVSNRTQAALWAAANVSSGATEAP